MVRLESWLVFYTMSKWRRCIFVTVITGVGWWEWMVKTSTVRRFVRYWEIPVVGRDTKIRAREAGKGGKKGARDFVAPTYITKLYVHTNHRSSLIDSRSLIIHHQPYRSFAIGHRP